MEDPMRRWTVFAALLFFSVSVLIGQNASVSGTHLQMSVPHLIKLSGTLKNVKGQALTGTVGVNLAIYKEEQGGAALWQEVQNLTLDSEGHYDILLGSSTGEGIPLDLFVSGEARWLGMQVQGEEEQPRVLLVSVPYALKAGDAETLGGRPASSFVLAPATTTHSASSGVQTATSALGLASAATTIAGGGTQNVITKFDSTGANVINSSITDNGSAVTTSEPVGIGTASPGAQLDVEFTTAVPTNAMLSNINYNNTAAVTNAVVSAFDMNFVDNSTASNLSKQTARIAYLRGAGATGGVTAFDSALTATEFLSADAPFQLRGVNIEGPTVSTGKTLANFTGLYIGSPGGTGTTTNKFALVTEPNAGNVGIGTTSPSAPLEVSGNFKLSGSGSAIIFPNGTVMSSAASGTGGGTITGVVAGAGLAGGGTAGAVSLAIPNGGISNAMLADNSVANGNIADAGLSPAKIAGTAATIGANSFTGNQNITGNLSVSGTLSGNGAGLTNINAAAAIPTGYSILGASPVPPSGFSNAAWLTLNGQQPWLSKAALPAAVYGPTSGVVNGKVYVIGGNGTVLNGVSEYTPTTDSWAAKTAMPTGRYYSAAAVVNSVIYVVGGNNGTILTTVEAYSPSTNSWATEATMPAAVDLAAAATVNGKVYVFGGRNASFTNTNTVYAYDPSTNTWTIKAPMPTARSGAVAVAINNLIYVVGGFNVSYLSTTEVYNPASDSWSAVSSATSSRAYAVADTIHGLLYIADGENSSGILNTVEVYDPASNTWFKSAPALTTRYLLTGGAVSNTLYVIAGYNAGGVATNEQFDPSKLTYLFQKN
jgi:N-acetylneuraminic acid mutarotase